MKKIDLTSVVVYGFISVAILTLVVILGFGYFGQHKVSNNWETSKANTAVFEIEGLQMKFQEPKNEPLIKEAFASVDTIVTDRNGACYFLIKNNHIFKAYYTLGIQTYGYDVTELMKQFTYVEKSTDTNGELYVRK